MRTQRGLRALAETCPQYLVLSLEEHMPGKSWDEAKYVFTPPLREKHNQAPLWKALEDGTLSVVSTDHCPFRFADQKSLGKNDFTKIPNGGPGIENRLQILWQFGVNAGQLTPEKFVELCCTAPARIFGMPQKGVIAPGKDADILLWDPKASYTISAATQRMATDYSMFEGWKVQATPGTSSLAESWWSKTASGSGRPGAGASSSAKPMPGDSPDAGPHRRRSALIQRDLAPTTAANRTWNTYNYIALWFSMSMEVTTYMLASSLIAGGMNWKQAIFTILLGNLIVLVPMLLNAHAGAKYGIPFPVFVRASFGALGANIPAMLRALVACGWFGIQSWLGGQAIAAMIAVVWPATAHNPAVLWASFLGFWLLNMFVVWCGVESIRFLQSFSAPFMLVMSLMLLFWMLHKAGGFGPMLSAPSRFHRPAAFFISSFPSLTAMVGYWATLSLNIPDFTRYAKSQDSQIVGQAFGLPVAMTLYSFIGIACTSASEKIFGEPIWSPITLLGRFHQPVVALLALVAVLVATLNVNIGANVVSPSNDFSNLAPRLISFRTGGLITGFLGLAMMPWKLMSTFGTYIFGWLVGYSGLLGPVAGIMVADYFLIRGTHLDVASLYHRGGPYEYSRGFNPRAVAALVAGVFVALIGLAVPPVRFLYDYAWFVGFFVSAAIYYVLMLRYKPVEVHA